MSHDLTPEQWAEIKRLYDEIMRGYVPAMEVYDAAIRALYPPPIITTTDHTGPVDDNNSWWRIGE